MPKLPRRQIGTTFTQAHVLHLLTGFDWFNDAFGNDIEAARQAWPFLKDRVYALHAKRKAVGRAVPDRPWGEQFDKRRQR